jgi:CBS domain-containing protein
LLIIKEIGVMPVRDAGARIVGMFSERDIVGAFSKGVELCSPNRVP